MGMFDSLFGKSETDLVAAKGSPFAVSTSFRPMRLTGRTQSSVELLLALQNVSDAPQICSVVIELPKSLGFDGVGLHKTKELRLGAIDPKVRKDFPVTIQGSSMTQPGLYRLKLTVYSHYRDYTHVLNSVSKTLELRVV